MFVSFSNQYAARHNKPANITKEEIRSFFAILLLSGYAQVPRHRMFRENSADAHNDLVSNALSRDRSEYTFSNLHCCDNTSLDKSDRFAKLKPLIQQMNETFQKFAPLHENYSVNGAMVPYFDRHEAKQFIHEKLIWHGYKLWIGVTDFG